MNAKQIKQISMLMQRLQSRLYSAGLNEQESVLAVEYAVADNILHFKYTEDMVELLHNLLHKSEVSDILWCGFHWLYTPEGDTYWRNKTLELARD